MKIPKKYKKKGTYSSIFIEKSRTTRKGNKVPESYKAVFAFLDPNGDWDISYKRGRDREELDDWLEQQKDIVKEHGVRVRANRKGSFTEFAEIYKESLKSRELVTVDEEIKKVDVMIQFFQGIGLQDVDYDTITRLKKYLLEAPNKRTFYRTHKKTGQKSLSKTRDTKRSKTTVNRYLSRLKDLLGEAEISGRIKSVPSFKRLIQGSAEKARTQFITPSDFQKLLGICGEVISGYDAKSLILPLIAGYETGARVGELKEVRRCGEIDGAGLVISAGILYVDHDRKSGVLAMPIEKTRPRKFKKVPISRRLYEAMTSMGVWEMKDDTLIFPLPSNYRRSLKARLKRAHLDPTFHFHALRAVNNTNRMFASQAKDDLQAQIGHAKGSRMSDTNYFRPDYEQLMDSIGSYNEYIDERFHKALDSETVN